LAQLKHLKEDQNKESHEVGTGVSHPKENELHENSRTAKRHQNSCITAFSVVSERL
jgi:hypothetical protein